MFKCPHCKRTISNRLLVAAAGRIGGKQTAKRGAAYFRRLQALRKHRRGGRPRKQS